MERRRSRRTADNPAVTKELMARMLNNPRYDIPYFAHEPLNKEAYPGEIGKPVGPPPENPLPGVSAEKENKEDKADSDWSEELADNWDFLKDLENDPDFDANLDAILKDELNETGSAVLVGAGDNKKPAEKPVEQPAPQPKKERPILSKKVVADMDSDDELLWNLKLAKWTEKQIHARFLAEGRTRYSQKTIGTRFCRMKKIMRNHVDALLQAGETDWFSNDDEKLLVAIARADERVRKIQDNLEKYKWGIVSQEMKDLLAVTDYSGKACRDRYNARMRGSATVPLDLRPNPDTKTQSLVKARKEREAKLRELERMPR